MLETLLPQTTNKECEKYNMVYRITPFSTTLRDHQDHFPITSSATFCWRLV